MNPSITPNGQPVGAIVTCIKTLQRLVDKIKPTKIVVAWDAGGGSARRRSIERNYKSGRKPPRLNRVNGNLTPQEEVDNKIWQNLRLLEYYNSMPLVQFLVEDVEADDIIAYVCRSRALEGAQKIIVSSDKDFIQLCDEKTILYRDSQKEILNVNRTVEKYGIHPNNFALARAMVGDTSDNLKGIDGIGLKTATKRFPFLKEEKCYTIDDVTKYARSVDSNLKVYERVVENKKLLRKNYSLMQLYSPLLSLQTKQMIEESLGESCNAHNKTEITKMMIEDGIIKFNWDSLFQFFKKLHLDK
tara:strand:- start:2136 stop:3038 length:903 start_codon:yes stop_codon:yes gene_type:complete